MLQWVDNKVFKKTDQGQKDRIPTLAHHSSNFTILLSLDWSWYYLLHSTMLGFSLLGFFLQNIRTCADKISHCPESSRWSRIVKILVAHVALNAFQNLIFSEELLSCLSVQDFEYKSSRRISFIWPQINLWTIVCFEVIAFKLKDNIGNYSNLSSEVIFMRDCSTVTSVNQCRIG